MRTEHEIARLSLHTSHGGDQRTMRTTRIIYSRPQANKHDHVHVHEVCLLKTNQLFLERRAWLNYGPSSSFAVVLVCLPWSRVAA